MKKENVKKALCVLAKILVMLALLLWSIKAY